jgi:hypothetical protein
MRQKVETCTDFSIISQKGDAIGLLKLIKDVEYNYQVQKYVPQALNEAKSGSTIVINSIINQHKPTLNTFRTKFTLSLMSEE